MSHRVLVLAFLILLPSLAATALPRFAARTGFACRHCHVNPTGGAMRSPFGVSYGREELPITSWQAAYALDDLDTAPTEFLSYGLDTRFLYFYQSKDTPSVERSSFFPMQADVYLNLAVSRRVNVVLNPAFGPFQRYEVFGLARVLPSNGFLKVGRFTPSYGIRLDDHTSFVREATPFRNNSGQQTGLEVGFAPGPLSVLTAITNGVAGDRSASVTKAYYARADGRFRLGPANVLLGASLYNDKGGGSELRLVSGFGAIGIGEALSVVADVEHLKGNSSLMSVNGDRNQRNSAGASLTQVAMMIEVNYALIQGLDLKLMYDFFDPNTDVKSGTATRYSGGFEFFPLSGVEVRPLYRYTNDTVLGTKTTDIHVLLHFYL